jgi:hypothetical protein
MPRLNMNTTSWPSLARLTELYTIAVVVAISVACGGDDGNGSGGGDPVPVSNGARLGWNQRASSVQQLQSMTFRLYVDDTPMPLSELTCGQAATARGYECSGRLPTMLPGRHVLRLTSVLGGVESEQSQPLTIMVTASTTMLSPEEPSQGGADPFPSVVCVGQARECYSARVLATGLMDVTALNALPDHRLLFIEGGSQVRVIERDVLLSEPALVASDPGTKFVGLAVDTAFWRTRFVFVASAEPRRSGAPQLNITRYRELAGSLGEGAQIVTGLPFREGALAPLSIDGQGLLYVALPGPTLSRASAALPNGIGGGAILRFDNDGRVPSGNWRSSPLISYGYAQPTGLAIDTVHKRLWLAGQDPSRRDSLSMLSLSATAESEVRGPEPVGQFMAAPSVSEPSIALLPKAGAKLQPWLLASSNGQLLRAIVGTSGGVGELSPVALELSMPLRSVAEGPAGSFYVVAGTTDVSILRLIELSDTG